MSASAQRETGRCEPRQPGPVHRLPHVVGHRRRWWDDAVGCLRAAGFGGYAGQCGCSKRHPSRVRRDRRLPRSPGAPELPWTSRPHHTGASVERPSRCCARDESFDKPIVDQLLPWVEQEQDPRVTRALTAGLVAALDPRAERPLPALTRHPAPEVRALAITGLHGQVSKGHPQALTVVTTCTRDADATVREAACTALGNAPADLTGPADALAACLADEREGIRITAAVRLALRDDPRGDELLRDYDAVDQGSPYYWDLLDVWRHRTPKPADPC
ncbi:HEAT repeat domain-containing protein [Streptomyces sp. cg2]|uniref:HEAT repeat domain-containing protein n=1 Tax=Streptomyces sp. cg2 TaxID=3238799 RepID=UPI0034E1BB79